MSVLPAFAMVDAALGMTREAIAKAAEADHRLPTPCTRWDLGTLVRHVADSARTLRELLTDAAIGPVPLPGCSAAQAAIDDLADVVTRRPVGRGSTVIALLGSYELSLHAWDLNQAIERDAALPRPLVDALLTHAPIVLDHHRRAGLFAPPPDLPASSLRTDLDRLLAMFGRSRDWR